MGVVLGSKQSLSSGGPRTHDAHLSPLPFVFEGERARVRGGRCSDLTASRVAALSRLTPTLSPAYEGEGAMQGVAEALQWT